jgi:hypothetical protein
MVKHYEAQVKNGRLVMDEPTELPEGTIIELVSIDFVLANGGDVMDKEERAALDRELETSLAEAEAGELLDFGEVLADLRGKLDQHK